MINIRWEMYTNFLDVHSEYDKIFVTDIRDVIFQGNVFENYIGYQNFLVYGSTKYKYQTSGYDSQWFRNIFSEDDYQQIKDKLVICCGMVLGSRVEMINFFKKMTELLKNSDTWGDEQAAMNYLIYNKQLPIENLIESNVETGAFINLGVIGTPHVGFVKGDKILREDGGMPAVVHQWTGYDYGINFVNEFYRAKEFQPDEKFTDTRCALEQVFCLIQIKNWRAATKFFIGSVLYAEDLKTYDKKLIELLKLILGGENFFLDSEILSVAVQKAITRAFPTMGDAEIDKVYNLFLQAEGNHSAVHLSFRRFLKNVLFSLAKYCSENDLRDIALNCIDRISNIDLPIGADIYLLQAEIYRAAGKKDEALAAYKKAIDAT